MATDILSKSKQELAGCSLKVKQIQVSTKETKEMSDSELYEQDRIRIYLSGKIPRNSLSLYLCTVLDIEEECFTWKEFTDISCVLLLNATHTLKGMSNYFTLMELMCIFC